MDGAKLQDITAIIVNYKTHTLTKTCVESLRHHYPNLNICLIDNGSGDESTTYLQRIATQDERVTALLNETNRYHGPALHQGIMASHTRYIFTLDSDCRILQPGFLEAMHAFFKDSQVYAVGEQVHVNRYGYHQQANIQKYIPYIHPYAMLLDRTKYRGLKPFVHHGSPCLYNMKDALKKGYTLQDFKLAKFIYHLERGTCSQYGYGIGFKGKIEFLLNKWGVFN